MNETILFTLCLSYLMLVMNNILSMASLAWLSLQCQLVWFLRTWHGLRSNDLPAKDCIKFLWVSFTVIILTYAAFLMGLTPSHQFFNWITFLVVAGWALGGTQRIVGYIEGKSENIGRLKPSNDYWHRN